MIVLIDVPAAICVVGLTLGGLLAASGRELTVAFMAACTQSPSRDAVRSGIVVLERGKSLALAAGALAALIGLVLMLKEMDDPHAIAPGFARACVPVVYALFLAFGVFAPLTARLRTKESEAGAADGEQSLSDAATGSAQQPLSFGPSVVGKVLTVLIIGIVLGIMMSQSQQADYEDGLQLTREQYIETFEQHKAAETKEPMPAWGAVLAMCLILGVAAVVYETLGAVLGAAAGRIPFLSRGRGTAAADSPPEQPTSLQVVKRYIPLALIVIVLQVILAFVLVRFVLEDRMGGPAEEPLEAPLIEELLPEPE